MRALACACVLSALTVAMLTPLCAHAVPLEIVYADAPGEGFFDPERGAARRAASNSPRLYGRIVSVATYRLGSTRRWIRSAAPVRARRWRQPGR